MRTRYYYDSELEIAYKFAGPRTCPANLDVLMWRMRGAERITVRTIGKRFKHDMTRAHMWEPMDILFPGVTLYNAY